MAQTRIIAHRGASGHLPEHTLAAKALAYGLGVDFLEQDVVASRDGELVVLHDTFLDAVSDVAVRFPGRHRKDGRHYVIDFDLAELRKLRLRERRNPEDGQPVFPGRFEAALDGLRIVTLREEIEFVASLNASMGRAVGICPEIKAPAWHGRHGIDIVAAVVDMLAEFGFDGAGSNAYLQCFAADALERIADAGISATRRILLLDDEGTTAAANARDGWACAAGFATGIGLPYRALLNTAAISASPVSSGLAERIHAAGLEVHPYTLRRETFQDGCGFAELLEFLIFELKVDGIFCDQPEVALAVRTGRG